MEPRILGMIVRAAEDRDTPGIETLLERSYPTLMEEAYEPDVLALALPSMTRANPALVGSGTFYVVVRSGEIIGCGGWTFSQPGSDTVVDGLVHARHFAVDPSHARSGIGRAIFERSARDAVAAGAARMQALSSLNAELFYKEMGLMRLDLISLRISAGLEFPVVLMEGPLSID